MKSLVKWTVEDYHRLIEAGIFSDRHLELLAGEIIEMPPEGPFHSYVTDGLADYLRNILQNRAAVRETHPITLLDSEPQPDIAIARPPRSRYPEQHPQAEDIFWLLEISQSTLSYDLNEKKAAYAKAGIREYWVIDVRDRRIHIFRQPQGEDYQIQSVIDGGNITPEAFPDLKLSSDRFLS